MRKVFISTMPMQKVSDIKYASRLYPQNAKTAYPVTISLENNCEEGDRLTVLTIVSHSDEGNLAEDNYKNFKVCVERLVKERGAEVDFIEVPVSTNITSASPRELYLALADKLQAGDAIYADITYGFKYNSIAVFAALNRAYQLLPEVEIEEISYGALYTGAKKSTPEYFDMTSLFYLNSLNSIDGLGGLKLN